MKAGDPKVREIFNGNRVLEIPFFQRSYVWKDDNWKRFINDMKDISSTDEEYFFGSLIIKQKSEGVSAKQTKVLIDGQQRITTLIIFFKFLSMNSNDSRLPDTFNTDFKLRNKKEIALHHNHNDREEFEYIINMESYQEKFNSDKHSNSQVINFYKYLIKNIKIDDYDYDTIIRNLKFVSIDLDSHEDEQRIFDTTNSLGVRLTTAALLKNYLFNKEQIDFYESHWKPAFEKDNDTKKFWDARITTGRSTRENIDLFLSSYLQIKLQDKKFNLNSAEKLKLGLIDKLFDGYKQFIGVTKITNEQLVKEIKEYADVYKEYIRYDVMDCTLTDERSIDRINTLIFGLENSVLIPYILFISKNSTREESDKIFCYLESYIIRRIICKATNKNYSTLFYEELISNEINTLDKLKEYINNKAATTEAMPNDKEVYAGFTGSQISNKQAAAVIYMLETKIREWKKHTHPLLALSKYSLEHLMPKNWQKNWGILNIPEEIDKRNATLLTLGNLAIITTSLNASIQDGDWKTKKNGKGDNKGLIEYASGLETLDDILQKDVWDEEAIAERANFLATKSLEVWKN